MIFFHFVFCVVFKVRLTLSLIFPTRRSSLRDLCSLKTRQCRKAYASPMPRLRSSLHIRSPFGLLLCSLSIPRKEVIQPHLPIRLPCYDFTPVIAPALDGCLLAVGPPALGVNDFRGVTGGVYKARERIHRSMLTCDY